jgi:hypothetical protein
MQAAVPSVSIAPESTHLRLNFPPLARERSAPSAATQGEMKKSAIFGTWQLAQVTARSAKLESGSIDAPTWARRGAAMRQA